MPQNHQQRGGGPYGDSINLNQQTQINVNLNQQTILCWILCFYASLSPPPDRDSGRKWQVKDDLVR